jgi:hypothetical protein
MRKYRKGEGEYSSGKNEEGKEFLEKLRGITRVF